MKRFRMEEEGEVEGSTDVANLLMLLSSSSSSEASDGPQHPRRLFRCKSCSRQFPSFQALGGHRASHKKPRLGDGDHAQQPAAPPKPRAHACSICGLEFPMGQALGGHMRRHRAPGGASPLVLTEKKPGGAGEKKGELGLDLDLKLAPLDKDGDLCTLRLGLGLSMAGYLYSPKSLCFATV